MNLYPADAYMNDAACYAWRQLQKQTRKAKGKNKMPSIKVSKESLKGLPQLPPGVYHVRLDGFKPKTSAKGGSVNLNPTLKIINDPNLTDRTVPENLNSQAGWVHLDFVHAFGLPMQEDGDDAQIPGAFRCKNHGDGDCQCDPAQFWEYVGPLVGKVGQVEVVITSNGKGGTKPSIKRYFCAVPGCTEKHSESLVK